MGNKCCKSIKSKYFSHLETNFTSNSQAYDNSDELIITKEAINKYKKESSKSIYFEDSEMPNTKREFENSNSLEYLKTLRDCLDFKPEPNKLMNQKVIKLF